ncbi:MAG: methenyltetrahydromethanopterin cyclohydrolase [Candidatus Bathyarchaeia archaeon]
MPRSRLSVNAEALKLVDELCNNREKLRIIIKEAKSGVTIIDAGIEAEGGFAAGKIITEICMGGLGETSISSMRLGNLELPSISVFTDQPAISTLGSQLAGWHIKVGKYSAVASGPARALALKPRSMYEKIGYKDESDPAVLVIETSKEPPEEVISYISDSCGVAPDKLFLILVPTSSVAGFTQISGRVAETGIHKLVELGFDPRLITHAWGYAPIMPVHPDYVEAMGRANDAILYGGVTYYVVSCDDDKALKSLVERSVSSASKQYGRPFAEIFREANFDFYKIDPSIFAPAVLTINNAKTGKVFTAGRINVQVLVESAGL